MKTLRIRISGQVQGLGFRPYVYRMAIALGVRGTVANSRTGVMVLAQGPRARAFCERLRLNPPRMAVVAGFAATEVSAPAFADFRIARSDRPETEGRPRAGSARRRQSTDAGSLRRPAVDVLPDIATCPDCRRDLSRPGDRRQGYAFTNCTQCGPRYTIIRSLPYDRPGTTMAGFRLCADCAREYSDPMDRRFHAQPNACPACGPTVALLDARGRAVKCPDPVAVTAAALAAGRVVALRSLGGFQLACDATSSAAVARLRRYKGRPTKPLALMVESARDAALFCRVGRAGRELLRSAAAPIVLLPKRYGPGPADSIAPGNERLGVMQAYTPLHLLLFARLREQVPKPPVLVMTSANPRDEAIIGDADELFLTLRGGFDLALTHNRPIANRCDDSVVLADSPPVIVRRARGYAPRPVRLGAAFHVKHPVLALGGDMQNCFCLAAGDRAWLSPHLGNPAAASTERLLRDTLDRYRQWTGVRPTRLACDLHPDYASTRLAERMSRELDLPLLRVQHHYAHALAALAAGEPGPAAGRGGAGKPGAPRRPALGLCFDGTGYGTDGAIWGCEFILVRPDRSWLRVGHLRYLRLPDAGAELADPARIAEAYLRQARTVASTGRLDPLADRRGSPVPGRPCFTSSLGRLFDAVAALAGLKRHVSFEGEAAIALESVMAEPALGGVDRRRAGRGYRFPVSTDPEGMVVIDPVPALLAVESDARAKAAAGLISTRFHRGFARAAVAAARRVVLAHRVELVVLAGGSFQNSFLRNRIARELKTDGLTVRHATLVPVNDGGLSLGQAVAAG